MEDKIIDLKKIFEKEIKNISSVKEIDEMKVHYLGKKGPIQDLMKGLKDLQGDQKSQAGKLLNDLKEFFFKRN